jgi:site-specific DNA-methyltransferase (adenine-specific)
MVKSYYNHAGITIYHGDCLEVMPQLPQVDMILTDPPYGTTDCKWDSIIPFEPMWEQIGRIIKNDGVVIMTASQPFTTALISSNPRMFKYCWVWNKKLAGNGILAKKQPLKIHEDIVVFGGKNYFPQMETGKLRGKGGIIDKHGTFSNKERKKVWNNYYYPKSILEFSGAGMRRTRKHPTQKPVELMKYLLKTYTDKNGLVLDFAMGSGTTLVAAKELCRRAIGIEISEEYCEIAVKRLAQEALPCS